MCVNGLFQKEPKRYMDSKDCSPPEAANASVKDPLS